MRNTQGICFNFLNNEDKLKINIFSLLNINISKKMVFVYSNILIILGAINYLNFGSRST